MSTAEVYTSISVPTCQQKQEQPYSGLQILQTRFWELYILFGLHVATGHIASNLYCRRNAAHLHPEAMDTGPGTNTLATGSPHLPTCGPARAAPLPVKRSAFSIESILSRGRVFPVWSTPSVPLNLPKGFWDGGDSWLTPELQQQVELDLKW